MEIMKQHQSSTQTPASVLPLEGVISWQLLDCGLEAPRPWKAVMLTQQQMEEIEDGQKRQ